MGQPPGGASRLSWSRSHRDLDIRTTTAHGELLRDLRRLPLPSQAIETMVGWHEQAACLLLTQDGVDTMCLIGGTGRVEKLMWEGDFAHNASHHTYKRQLVKKALADVPGDVALPLAQLNARRLFNFWD